MLELPVYRVVNIENQRSRAICFGRGLVGGRVDRGDPANFLDRERFMSLPHSEIEGSEHLALDFDALAAMPSITDETEASAKDVFLEALTAAEIDLEEGRVKLRTGWLEIIDRNGCVVIAVPISIRLWFESSLKVLFGESSRVEEIPREGPGARITAVFDAWGQVTQYRYAWQELKPVNKKVPVISKQCAEDLWWEKYRTSLPAVEYASPKFKLVYYIPSIETSPLKQVVPHYLMGGTARVRGGDTVLLETVIPANEESKDNFVAPVKVSSIETCPPVSIFNKYDFGTENVLDKSDPDEELGLRRVLIDHHGADVKSFCWRGDDARQRHFKDPGAEKWVDNAKFCFFVGHGFNFGEGFIFNEKHSEEHDHVLRYCEVIEQWGDQRLNWLALHSCNVLNLREWRLAFNGLHLLLSFQTVTQLDPKFSERFAENMVEKYLTVARSWFDAVIAHQPDGWVGAIMGAIRKGDYATNYNDFYHDSVGPDIAADEIEYFFRIIGP